MQGRWSAAILGVASAQGRRRQTRGAATNDAGKTGRRRKERRFVRLVVCVNSKDLQRAEIMAQMAVCFHLLNSAGMPFPERMYFHRRPRWLVESSSWNRQPAQKWPTVERKSADPQRCSGACQVRHVNKPVEVTQEFIVRAKKRIQRARETVTRADAARNFAMRKDHCREERHVWQAYCRRRMPPQLRNPPPVLSGVADELALKA